MDKQIWDTCTMELFSPKKESNSDMWNQTDETSGHDVMQSKLVLKR